MDKEHGVSGPPGDSGAYGRRATGFDIPILLYHHLLPKGASAESVALPVDLFEQHLDVLAQGGFKTIAISDLAVAIEEERCLPEKPIVITFDDGFTSFSELATPALAARGMVATVYALAGDLGGYSRWDDPGSIPPRHLMDAAELRAVRDAGMEVGVHGWYHRDLTKCTPDELEQEVSSSKIELQSKLGVRLDHFAYPYGHYSAKTPPLIASAGYRSGMAVRNKERAVTANPLAMRRISIHAGDTPRRFRIKISRAFLKYSALRERRFGNKRWPGIVEIGWH